MPVNSSGDARAGARVVEGGEEDVVLLGGADGDLDALAGERAGDDRPGLQRRGELRGLLPHRQPHEVGLAVGDGEPALAQRRGEPLPLGGDGGAAPPDLVLATRAATAAAWASIETLNGTWVLRTASATAGSSATR